MKIIPLIPQTRRITKKTVVDQLITRCRRAGETARLQFLGNNPVYAGNGLIA